MLQPRKHAGKAICKSPIRDHRQWKVFSPKGLSEVEEIDKEEVSIKLMQSLERLMRAHPAVWSESSMQHLLVEIADTHYARSEIHREAEERLRTVIMRMLVPMAKIMEVEQESVKVERQKIQEATLALQRVREECQQALVYMTQEHERSARDLAELGKALEENRLAAEEAGRKLTEKEEQIHLMLQKQQELVVRLVCGGPTEFLKWAREEIQSHGLVDLHNELEHAWWPIQLNEETLNSQSECSTPEKKTTTTSSGCNQFVYKDSEKPSLSNVTMALLCVVASETFQQMVESCGRVKSPFSLPSAIAGFWMGLAGRMTYLAMVTLMPQVVQKSGLVSIQ